MKKIVSNKKNYILFGIIFLLIGMSIILLIFINKYKMKLSIKEESIKINNAIHSKSYYEENIEKGINDLKQKFNNDDIIGVLYISDFIVVPILQGEDNTYYLTRGISKNKVPGGSAFLDYRTNIGDKQINIYGHSSKKYDLPFNELKNYLNNSFIQNNDYIELVTKDKIYKYQIASIYIDKQNKNAIHYKYSFNTNEEWNNHYEEMMNKSIYTNNVNINYNNNILIIQTCLFNKYKDNFLIIMAKEINQ